MPTYQYRCPKCQQSHDSFRRIDDRDKPLPCPDDGTEMKREITPTGLNIPEWNLSYKCVATGAEITSMRQRKYELEKRGLVDAREIYGGSDDPPELPKLPKKQEMPDDLKRAMKREGLDTQTGLPA